ncbi:hypothetical protein A2U01_0071355, partial [Trifolium medium]|nr:hypothetical protein [Trifolium medium]
FAPGATNFAPGEISRKFSGFKTSDFLPQACVPLPQACVPSPQAKFPEQILTSSFAVSPQAPTSAPQANFPDILGLFISISFLLK